MPRLARANRRRPGGDPGRAAGLYRRPALSYAQDAVATEAYLRDRAAAASRCAGTRGSSTTPCTTAATRAVWVQFRVAGVTARWPSDPRFRAACTPECRPCRSNHWSTHPTMRRRCGSGPRCSNPCEARATLRATHNDLDFHTGATDECCLPTGATRATLRGDFPTSRAGDVLVFEEVLGPLTGNAARRRSRTTRATRVRLSWTQAFDGAPAHRPADRSSRSPRSSGRPTMRLPFPVCVSAPPSEDHGAHLVEDVSIVLRQHRACRPRPHCHRAKPRHGARSRGCGIRLTTTDHCCTGAASAVPPRFRPSWRKRR